MFAGLLLAALLDLNALVTERCGPPGYQRDGGCAIELPDGTHEIASTVQIGDCALGSTGTRNSVALIGMGAGTMANLFQADPNRYSTAGTTLKWVGPAGGTMLEVCGSWFTLQHLTLDGNRTAGVGVRLVADNSKSAVNHFSRLASVAITSAGTGIEVAGVGGSVANGQIDFIDLERVSISDVEVGYLQDSQQSVGNHFRMVEVAAYFRGFVIAGGAFSCEECYVGQWPRAGVLDPGFIGYHFTRSALVDGRNFSHHQASIVGGHDEIRLGRFVVADVAENTYPIAILRHSFSLQCGPSSGVGCDMRVVDVKEKSPVLLESNVWQGATPDSKPPRPTMCSSGGWRNTGNVSKPETRSILWGCP